MMTLTKLGRSIPTLIFTYKNSSLSLELLNIQPCHVAVSLFGTKSYTLRAKPDVLDLVPEMYQI